MVAAVQIQSLSEPERQLVYDAYGFTEDERTYCEFLADIYSAELVGRSRWATYLRDQLVAFVREHPLVAAQ